MKKTLLFVIAMMAVVSANAQFSINGDGDVFINGSTVTKSIYDSFQYIYHEVEEQ